MMKSSLWKLILVLGAVIVGAALVFPKALRGKSEKTAPVQAQTDIYPFDVTQITIDVDVNAVLANKLLDVQTDISEAFQTGKVSLSSEISVNVTDDALLVSFAADADVSAGLALIDSQFRSAAVTGADHGPLFTVSKIEGLNYQIELTNAVKTLINERTVERSITVLRSRINPKGRVGVTFQKTEDDLIVLRLLEEDEGVSQEIKDRITASANLSFHTVIETSAVDVENCVRKEICPADTKLFFDDSNKGYLLVEERAVLTGADLKNASMGLSQANNYPIVNLTFNYAGATKFCEYTKMHVRQRVAVVINEKVITAPIIASPVCGGSVYIEGNFTMNEAAELALLLNAGALPTKLRVVEIEIVTIEAPANTKE